MVMNKTIRIGLRNIYTEREKNINSFFNPIPLNNKPSE